MKQIEKTEKNKGFNMFHNETEMILQVTELFQYDTLDPGKKKRAGTEEYGA